MSPSPRNPRTTDALRIAPSKWRAFFSTLNSRLRSAELSIEVLSKKDGDQVVGTGLLLRGFSFESRRAGADLLIEAGPPSAPVVHYVHHPLKVWIAETGLGAESDIMVESDRGVTTLIRLRRLPALPSSGRRRT